MEFNIEVRSTKIEDKNIKKIIDKLSKMYLKEVRKGNKVAYYYETDDGALKISFNKEICFYAASSIKILVCLMLLEENKYLDKKILITEKDLKQGTGIIKNQLKDRQWTVLELIKLCIVQSDNTAYLKLVELVGKDNLEKYGKSLGAKWTMEGKDSFGITSCEDMLVYWKNIKKFIENDEKYGKMLKEWLLNPAFKIIEDNHFVRKYGAYEIAYHECGYFLENKPYYFFCMTQLNQKKYKQKFVIKTAKYIKEIHKLFYKMEK